MYEHFTIQVLESYCADEPCNFNAVYNAAAILIWKEYIKRQSNLSFINVFVKQHVKIGHCIRCNDYFNTFLNIELADRFHVQQI